MFPDARDTTEGGGGETELVGICGGSLTTTTSLPTKFPPQPSERKPGERKTVQTAGQRGPDGGVGTAVEHPSSDPADSTLRTNLRLRSAGQYLQRGVGTYRMGGHSRGKIGDAPM